MQGETLPVLICYKSPESSTPFIRTMSEMEHCTVYFFKLTILTNHVLGFQTKEHINNIKLLKINLLFFTDRYLIYIRLFVLWRNSIIHIDTNNSQRIIDKMTIPGLSYKYVPGPNQYWALRVKILKETM